MHLRIEDVFHHAASKCSHELANLIAMQAQRINPLSFDLLPCTRMHGLDLLMDLLDHLLSCFINDNTRFILERHNFSVYVSVPSLILQSQPLCFTSSFLRLIHRLCHLARTSVEHLLQWSEEKASQDKDHDQEIGDL